MLEKIKLRRREEGRRKERRREEGRKQGRKEEKKEGKEARKEGKVAREEARKEGGREGSKERRKRGREGRKKTPGLIFFQGIMLQSRFKKVDFDDLVTAIMTCNWDVLSAGDVNALKQFIPTADEVRKLKKKSEIFYTFIIHN
jgi:hypothetical protein